MQISVYFSQKSKFFSNLMLNNRQPRKRENKKFTLIIVPGDDTDHPKSYVLGKFGLITISISIFLLMLLIAFFILVYTPVGQLFPITNIELENKYNKQIVQVQEKLNKLINEIVILRQYNVQLRKALGERVDGLDTSTTSIPNKSLIASDLRKQNNSNIEIEAFESKNENFAGNKTKILQSNFSVLEIELPLTKPTLGLITRDFAPEDGHLGIDISGKIGTLIYTPAPGTVIFSNWTYNYGYTLIIAHGSGYRTVYKHTQQLLKFEGEFVRRGDPIAIMGNTGTESSGPHLHFEIWKDGNPLNPKNYLLNINN